jgi:putative ABC transport system permease protein
MIRNYLLVSWRNLVRNRVFSTINVAGLAIGLTVCALIYQYVQFEQSYDQFNAHADRLYRVTLTNHDADNVTYAVATNHPATAPAMKADFPEVETFSRLARTDFFINSVTLSAQDKKGNPVTFNEEKMFLADSSFLAMFSYPMIEGDPKTALALPNSIVISESVSRKFFGKETAMGKQLSINRRITLTVTGVMKDVPQNSHLSFNVLVSFSSLSQKWGYDIWRWPEFYNYVLLKPGTDAVALQSKLPAFVNKYLGDVKREYKWDIHMYLQPVPAIHLTSHLGQEQDTNGNERVVYFLGLLGIFILVVAWINYINLATAKSLERSKEVGLRKVVGASKAQLVIQFFFDAFLVNILAMLLAVCLLGVVTPLFEQFIGKDISAVLYRNGLFSRPDSWLLAILILLTGTIFVGAYPALLLSSFNPAQVLKGKFYKSASGQWLRKGLVSFQYILSIFLIAGTITMYRQLSFMQKQDLGYSNDQLLVLKTPAVFDSTILNHVRGFKNGLSRLASAKKASISSGVPGKALLAHNGIRRVSQDQDANFNCYQQSIDEDFVATFGITLLAGRDFTDKDEFIYNQETSILINETASKRLGFSTPEEALHAKVTFGMGERDQYAEVIGVIKDYHQVSLREKVAPMMFIHPSFYAYNFISVQLAGNDVTSSIEAIKKLYGEAFPNNAFDYFFLDEYFNRQYHADVLLGSLFGIFTGLAIVIACLGLLGLSIFAVVHRTKEVGIRKVLGASVAALLALFSKDFVRLLAVAYVIAVPFVYVAANRWLDGFAFHISPGWEVFLAPFIILLIISISTIAFICLKAATANPTAALRQE